MFNREDLIKYNGMKKIISEGEYKIKGEAALMAASLFLWFNDLEKKIREDIEGKKPSIVESPKEVRK